MPEGGSTTFLTAAERREQQKKTDKKSNENPYAFLADIQDVCPSLSRWRNT
jgi:DNA mismatch repair protein MSH6